MKAKTSGSTIVVAVFLSAIMLMLVLGASTFITKEISNTAGFLHSERAYFAAESGMEIALLDLKQYPTQYVDSQVIPLSDRTEITYSILSRTKETSFTLPSLSNKKFRLAYDDDPTRRIHNTFPQHLQLTASPTTGIFSSLVIGILCQKAGDPSVTLALQDSFQRHESTFTLSDILQTPLKTPKGITQTFQSFLKGRVDSASCFLSFQNLHPRSDLTLTLKGTPYMSAPSIHILSRGKFERYQKIIAFDYQQKHLGSLFDFSLFHTENPLR